MEIEVWIRMFILYSCHGCSKVVLMMNPLVVLVIVNILFCCSWLDVGSIASWSRRSVEAPTIRNRPGSVVTVSERTSVASGSLASSSQHGNDPVHLTPQQLGAMGKLLITPVVWSIWPGPRSSHDVTEGFHAPVWCYVTWYFNWVDEKWHLGLWYMRIIIENPTCLLFISIYTIIFHDILLILNNIWIILVN